MPAHRIVRLATLGCNHGGPNRSFFNFAPKSSYSILKGIQGALHLAELAGDRVDGRL